MLIPTTNDYIIIGDIHGCIDEFKELLKQNGFKIDSRGIINTPINKSIVLLGDFIDRASKDKIIDTINFIHKNYYILNQKEQRFYIIRGNHEERVYQYITKDPTLKITPKILEEQDSKLKEKFLKLYQDSFVWLKYNYSEDFSISLTHAPCKERYLTKDDKISHANMIKSKSRSQNPNISLDNLIPYIHKEAKNNRHYHIFGHLSQPNIRIFKNKICIDTSAIYGNYLSCAIIEKDRLRFDSIPFLNKQKPATQKYNLLFDF
jgi:predicted MPP superfamily phosphohydrolase